jgi:hypothetical protein
MPVVAGTGVNTVLGSIGPHDPLYSRKVGVYLHNSPTPEQKNCLRLFFAHLRNGAVTVRHTRADPFLLVYTCGHVVTFTVDGTRVVDLAPSTIQ